MATMNQKVKEIRNLGNRLWDLELMCKESNSTSLILGFPDYSPPAHLVELVKDVVSGKDVLVNQYCARANGQASLLEAYADLYSPLFNRTLDPLKNVSISVGATGALLKLFRAFTSPGDEIIMFEPYFSAYKGYCREVRAEPVFVPLRLNRPADGTPPTSADFTFDPQELEAAFTDRTKLFVMNTPHNPTGKMFTQEEMEIVADLCKKYDVTCIADDVYEMFTFTNKKHIRMATLPGMWERTVTVGSAGKLFGMTGWAAGFSIGPEDLINKTMQCVVIPLNTALMEVYARAYRHEINRLEQPDSYFKTMPVAAKGKLEHVMRIMSELGLDPISPEGGYFIFCDVSKVDEKYCEGSEDKASNFSMWLCKNKGLGVCPANAFYSQENQHLGAAYVRICFMKSENTLNTAETCLKGLHVTNGNGGVTPSNGITNGHEQ